jgi:methionyl-tRNA formyltransferase
MSAKGCAVLRHLLQRFDRSLIAYVVTARDASVEEDYHEDIVALAKHAGIEVHSPPEAPSAMDSASCLFAVSWRWLLEPSRGQRLIVFHDSLLPRYRGFGPLVSALVNGEPRVGVTALLGSSEYDRGDVIAQESIAISYPIKIAAAIQAITPCYERLATEVVRRVMDGDLLAHAQDDAQATYSLWRDEDDYSVNWAWDAERIRRFVDAVGFPYRGAATAAAGRKYRILDCEAVGDVSIENRQPGKVVFKEGRCPVVVCGTGLLKIQRMIEEESGKDALPLARFRVRFEAGGHGHVGREGIESGPRDVSRT